MPSSLQVKKPAFANDRINRINKVLEINANFSVPATVETNVLNWAVSPTAGIKQKCFERIGRKKPNFTTLAQFPAGCTFKQFNHEGGVEFLVLSGVLSDANSDYSAGYYVRNPPGTYHEPFTREGCIVLFKLGQSQSLDRKHVVINTKDSVLEWLHAGVPGVSRFDLHHFAEEEVSLYRIRSECWITFKNQNKGIEVFVCEGSISVNKNCYKAGSWLRYPAGSKVKVGTKGGACLYVKKNIFPKITMTLTGKVSAIA